MASFDATCGECGSTKIMIEFRDWFGDDPHPPEESYGLFLVCTECGNAWKDENTKGLYD